MTLHKLTAGDGYTYLTRQVAVQDSTERGVTGLGDYYSQRGESPGVWMGSGLAHLPQFVPGAVTEAQMTALFGEGRHPDAGRIEAELRAAGHGAAVLAAATRLGSPFPIHDTINPFRAACAAAFAAANAAAGLPRDWPVPAAERAAIRTRIAREMFAAEYGRDPVEPRELSSFVARVCRQATTAVAGYDLTFSPVKSVSALWALAPRPVAEVIEAAHADAVADVLAWVERTAAFTRLGRGGVRQVETNGVLAAAFTHRDSRAGDPDLHTHLAVSNKVQTREGRWLALDGRPLHQQAVAASERYNTRLEALLVERLGVAFADRPGGAAGRRPVREIVGLDPRLLTAWSRRRAAIDARRSELAARLQQQHGRVPTAVEAIALAQQANLETRAAKHEPRSLAEQRAAWRQQATATLGGDAAVLVMLHDALHPTRQRAVALTSVWVDHAAATVIETVQGGRATWQECHLRAEAERAARTAGVPAARLDDAVDRIVTTALSDTHSVELTMPDPVPEPAALRRSDGTSVYVTAGSQLYTSTAILAAEHALLEAAGRRDGPVLEEWAIDLALLESAANGVELNPGQQQLVRELATSGARVQLALAPAGTGKTAALRALATAWAATGAVVGLAPSAAAAGALARETGLETDTIAKLLHGVNGGPLPSWAQRIRPAALVLVDEAGLAGTLDLARLVQACLDRGAVVRLIGDDAQLASVAAGGVLRDLARTHGAVRLSQVLRFTDPAEAAASVALRAGDPAAVGFYLDQHRVHLADLAGVTDQAYAAWAADRAAGRDSLLLAPTRELVTQLNHRAQTDHRARAESDRGARVRLGDGTSVGAGDVILTRRNDRRLPITTTDWVKNGDRWSVLAVTGDGSLRVRHHGTHRVILLPAGYVAEHVALGYATTVHTAQGVTADTCHLIATGAETRQLLYVGLTRGRTSNHVYLALAGDGDPHTVLARDTLLPPTAADLLGRILASDGAHTSATSTAAAVADPAPRLRAAVLAYQDALAVAAETVLGPDRLRELDTTAEHLLTGLTAAPAWPTLRGHLALHLLDRRDPAAILREVIGQRPLGSAADAAAVLDWRLHPTADQQPARPRPLPWLPGTPTALTDHPDWGDYLQHRRTLISDLAEQLTRDVAAWTPTTRPAWAARLGPVDPVLLGDVALWRAATGVDDTDPDLLGPPARYTGEAAHQHRLQTRLDHARRRPDTASTRWQPLAEQLDSRLLGDRHWPHLAERLTSAARAGLDITSLASQVTRAGGPLPDEHPAAALWWRLARHLSPAVLTGDHATVTTLRPAWTSDLPGVLGDDVTHAVLADPGWPALVAAVTTALEHGWTPRAILTTAHALIETSPDAGEPLPRHEMTTALIWRIGMLTNPPSADREPAPSLAEPAPAPKREELEQYGDAAAVMDEHWLAAAHPDDHEPAPADPPPPDHAPPPPRPSVLWVVEDPEHDALYAYPARHGIPAARLLELNEQALAYYRRCYPGSWAPAYLQHRLGNRDLALEAKHRYTPSYAPPGWHHLVHHLQRLGATDTELLAAGLAHRTRTGHLIDRFRDQLLFPLWQHDQLHGFIARRNPSQDHHADHDEHAGPKYLNTPDTDLFTKGAQLFGLHQARDLLASGATPVLVEGPFDALAITLAGAGHYAGLAPLGTAFTDRQADQLQPWIRADRPGIIVATDNDPAGRSAAERAYWQLTTRGDTPRHLHLPDRLDPADLLNHHGAPSLRDALNAADSLANRLVDQRIDRYAGHLDTAEGTVHAARAAADIIGALPPHAWHDAIEHAHTRLPGALPGLLHLEVIDAGQAWTNDPYTRAAARLHPNSAGDASPAQRWAALGRHIDPRLPTGPDWIPLAEALDAADASGYDVERALPRLAASAPLPNQDPARELHARLIGTCPAAAAKIESPINETTATSYRTNSRAAARRTNPLAAGTPQHGRSAHARPP